MEDKSTEYVVRDFSAVDRQVREMAKRENVLTWRLRIENLKRLGIPLILFATAAAIIILAIGIFLWLIKKEKIVEIDKVVEITKEIPVVSEKLKVVEVPIYIEKPYIEPKSKQIEEKQEISKNTSGLSLDLVENVIGSKACPNGDSFKNKCSGTYTYPNGSIYEGYWVNGYPSGEGKITFANGGSIQGNWESGILQSVEEEIKSEVTPLKSVTYFSSVSGSQINRNFLDIIVGHNFESGTDIKWKEAYCYLDLVGNFRVSLSRYDSFNSKIDKRNYIFNGDYTEQDFLDAQSKCPFEWSGFN